MKITSEKIKDILKENFELSIIHEEFAIDMVWADFLTAPEDGHEQIDVNIVIEGNHWESIVPLTIDTTNYDEKFSDVDKYEVENMGLDIKIMLNMGDDVDELTPENIWKVLFYNKVPEKYSQ